MHRRIRRIAPSIACQTCSLKWLTLLSATARTSGGLVDYVLVNAEDLVSFGEERLQSAPPSPPAGASVA